jgi:hypothetical protein
MDERRQNAKFRTLYWKFRDETNSMLPNESVRNNRTLFQRKLL